MNWHIFKRARVQAGLSFILLSAPMLLFALQAVAPNEVPAAGAPVGMPMPMATTVPGMVPPTAPAAPTAASEIPETSLVRLYGVLATYALMLGGALTYAVIRWLNKVGQNVPRDPGRVQAQVETLGAKINDDFASMDDRIDVLQAHVEANDRRTARMEGYVRAFAGSPVVVDPEGGG